MCVNSAAGNFPTSRQEIPHAHQIIHPKANFTELEHALAWGDFDRGTELLGNAPRPGWRRLPGGDAEPGGAHKLREDDAVVCVMVMGHAVSDEGESSRFLQKTTAYTFQGSHTSILATDLNRPAPHVFSAPVPLRTARHPPAIVRKAAEGNMLSESIPKSRT